MLDPIIIDPIDPSCTFIIPLDDEDRCIGDDLSVINNNFINLNNAICNLGLSAENHWGPMHTIVTQYSAGLISAHDTVKSVSAYWNSATETVNALSSTWISPITIIYPEPFTPPSDLAQVTAWVDNTFPIIEDNIGDCPRIRYIEGQRLWIITLEYATSLRNLQDTQSVTTGGAIAELQSISLRSTRWGIRLRKKKTRVITLTKAQPEVTWKEQVRIQTEWIKGSEKIRAASNDATISFSGSVNDQYIGVITGIEMMVINGSWVYTGILPGAI